MYLRDLFSLGKTIVLTIGLGVYLAFAYTQAPRPELVRTDATLVGLLFLAVTVIVGLTLRRDYKVLFADLADKNPYWEGQFKMTQLVASALLAFIFWTIILFLYGFQVF